MGASSIKHKEAGSNEHKDKAAAAASSSKQQQAAAATYALYFMLHTLYRRTECSLPSDGRKRSPSPPPRSPRCQLTSSVRSPGRLPKRRAAEPPCIVYTLYFILYNRCGRRAACRNGGSRCPKGPPQQPRLHVHLFHRRAIAFSRSPCRLYDELDHRGHRGGECE